MNVWLTSDEHYGHRNIIDYCKRPFKDVDEMTEELIFRHNALVKPGDLVYHLGDMFWHTYGLKPALTVMSRLKGQHFYIRGNHDELIDQHREMRDRFLWVKDLARVKLPRKDIPPFVLCHYAMRVWRGSHKGYWHFYGHSHGDLEKTPSGLMSCDVGVDCWKYQPVNIEELAAHLRTENSASLGQQFGEAALQNLKHNVSLARQ